MADETKHGSFTEDVRKYSNQKRYSAEEVASGDDTSTRKGKGIFCSPLMIFFTTVTVCILIAAAALMTYYIPIALEPTPTKAPIEDPTIPLMRGRLPTTVVPRLYQLTLRPFLYDDDVADSKLGKRFTFDGQVTVRVECIEPTDEITLHSKSITLHKSPIVRSVSTLDKTTDIFESLKTVEEYAFMVIKLKEMMNPHQEYSIDMEYSGILGDDEAGFYPSMYLDPSNNTRYIATTQMEGPYARRVLPCFDEPSFKATYEVHLEHRNDMSALANGLELETVKINDRWSKTKFTTVYFMPTYLLAFIVHDYSNISVTNDNGCLIRIWCPSHQIEYAPYALNVSNLVQTYFDTYLDYQYPLAKQDHIAIQDFGAGAMENWGLITYQDKYLLYELESVRETFYSLIITHELAHMWFGDLVTMEWWNDLWLNEGFATYMEHIGMDLVHPEFRTPETFYTDTITRGLSSDSLGTLHAVRAPVFANDEHISSQFSRISYQKGGSLLWMLEHLLTLDVFNAGVKNYLKERAYKNANAEYLWRQLTAADKGKGDNDIKKIMDTWTLQRGYPLITLTRSTDGKEIVATQKIFLQLDATLEKEEFGNLGYKWWVPLTYMYASGRPNQYDDPLRFWLDPSDEKTTFQLPSSTPADDWYLANVKMTGYYRVNYDEINWNRLMAQAELDTEAFSEENKLGLLYDSENLAKAEVISMDIYKSFAKSFENKTLETRRALLRTSSYFDKMLAGRSHDIKRRSLGNHSPVKAYMKQLADPLYMESGWDEHFVPDLPSGKHGNSQFDITATACRYGHDHCVSKSTTLFKEYMGDPQHNTIPKNFRKIVYCNGIRFGGDSEWNFANGMLQTSGDTWERSRWISALTCSVDHSRLQRYLQSMFDPSFSRNDAALMLVGVAENPDGYEVAWDFVRNNWEEVRRMFKRNHQMLSDVLEEITSHFKTNEQLQELLDFGKDSDLGSLKTAYESAVVSTKVNIRWVANKAADMERWIASRVQ
ncbi:aminopeptidase N-like [Patiria miniata]|uniref:Aminopeptidase n=1 Tax=Patiria miniata TaxID=46514 RepID=A0A914A335_PATMI|nr:aminopeptidase N-like [Patiria miniata]XP_038058009.1 aminopeptidase N-like [Patiria miniata]